MTPLETFLLKEIRGSALPMGQATLTTEAQWQSWLIDLSGGEKFACSRDDVDDALQSLMSQNLIQLKDGLWGAVKD